MTKLKGLLWYADKRPLIESLDRAVKCYREKYNRLPDALYINLDEPELVTDDFEIKRVIWVMRGHCFVAGDAA